MRAALYVRVSTLDQNLDNQLDDLRKYVERRGWREAVEYADRASGAKDSRPFKRHAATLNRCLLES